MRAYIYEECLERLQVHAALAFAARCARRVEPIVSEEAKERPEVEEAIQYAEAFARGDCINPKKAPGLLSYHLRRPDPDAMKELKPPIPERMAEALFAVFSTVQAAYRVVQISFGADRSNGKAQRGWEEERKAILKLVSETAQATVAGIEPAEAEAYDGDPQAFRRRSPVLAAQINLVRDSLNWDVDRLLYLRPANPLLGDVPIDPSEAGPLGPLWKGGMPYWYADRLQRQSKMKRFSIRRMPTLQQGQTVAGLASAVFRQDAQGSIPAQILCWHWTDFPDAQELDLIKAVAADLRRSSEKHACNGGGWPTVARSPRTEPAADSDARRRDLRPGPR